MVRCSRFRFRVQFSEHTLLGNAFVTLLGSIRVGVGFSRVGCGVDRAGVGVSRVGGSPNPAGHMEARGLTLTLTLTLTSPGYDRTPNPNLNPAGQHEGRGDMPFQQLLADRGRTLAFILTLADRGRTLAFIRTLRCNP